MILWDPKAALLSATRAKIAYMEPQDIDSLWLSSQKDKRNIVYYIFNGVKSEPKIYSDTTSDAFAYSYIQLTTLHIVFRGTKGYADVKTDIDEIRAELYPENPEIKVHNGFLKQFNSIKQQVLDTINNNLNDLTAIHFSGHSLGAALATIAAGYFSPLIRLDNNIRIVCHTIGCPRLGNKGFVKWWTDKVDESYRILNKHDPVPLVPVNPFYTHITGGLEIGDKNKVKIINRDTAWFLRILYLPWQIKCLNPISYHHCDTYTSRLKTLANWDITLL